MTFDLLEREALSLPTTERALLAEKLTCSLHFDPDVEQAWADEIERREARIVSGEAVWLDGETVMAELRAKFR